MQYVGPSSAVEGSLADHAEAVVREGISNAVRHSGATELAINVAVEDELHIEVIDNGRGVAGDSSGSGLMNLRKRAREVRGSSDIYSAPHRGTALRWSAPLP